MRSAVSLVVGAVLWVGAAGVARAQSASIDDQARFVADVEQAKAHLLISQELYAAGQAPKAALHASHPVQELGNRVIGPIKNVNGALGERVRALLKKPREAVDGHVARPQYEALVTEVSGALDDAVNQVVLKDVRASVAFQAKVIGRLLDAVVEEYDEAWKSGKIAQIIEYQDAYGFFRRAHALYRTIASRLPRSSDADFAALASGFPGVSPPAAPLPLGRVKALVARISTSLARAAPAAATRRGAGLAFWRDLRAGASSD